MNNAAFSRQVARQASVSVVIVNWNSRELLQKCLQHLLKQTIQPVQIIIVDNASSDNSVNVADGVERTVVLRMKTNLGFAAGNNRALSVCTGEFVALLNPDAFPEPDWLEKLLDAAQDYPDVAAFGSRQLCQATPGILDGIGDSYHMSGLIWRQGYGAIQQDSDLTSREIFSPCAAAALYRRQALIDMGGFDEDFFCYVEDIDLGFRLKLAGYKARYVPDAVVLHVGSATTGGQDSDFCIYHGHRNLVWAFVKNMPGALFWLLLPLYILLNIMTISLFTMRGRGGVILRAKRDALIGLSMIWRKRRQIQRRRVVSVKSIWQQFDKRMIKVKMSRKKL